MAVIDYSKNIMKTNQGTAATTTITTATKITTAAYPHEVGKDLIPELAMRVYSSQLDSFREALSNAFDENSQKKDKSGHCGSDHGGFCVFLPFKFSR